MFAYRLGKGGASLVVTLLLPIVTPTPFAYVYRCTPPAPLSFTLRYPHGAALLSAPPFLQVHGAQVCCAFDVLMLALALPLAALARCCPLPPRPSLTNPRADQQMPPTASLHDSRH